MAGDILRQMLDELIQGKVPKHELSGGLLLRFNQAEVGKPNRMLCYRLGVKPSLTELGTVRRELEALLSRRLEGSGYWQWHDYWCFTYSWEPMSQEEQLSLFPKGQLLKGAGHDSYRV